MRSITSIALVFAAASVLAACSAPQTADSAQAQPKTQTQTAQGCSSGEMVNVGGSRLKQPCGSQPVKTSSSFGSNGL